MLLVDGIKYELWVPKKEEEEFEPLVVEHITDIFGARSIFIGVRQRLKSKAGIGSIPDGYVINFGDAPSWHVIEMELSCHPLYDHIVTQISKFLQGLKNHNSLKELVDLFYSEIDSNEFSKLTIKNAIKPVELHKYLTDLVSTAPEITVIIEQNTSALEEALSILPSTTNIIEFKTYVRSDIRNITVHAHSYEPLYTEKIVTPKSIFRSLTDIDGRISIVLTESNIKYKYIYIPKQYQSLFPSSNKQLHFETDNGVTQFEFHNDKYGLNLVAGVPKWYNEHPDLKVGGKIYIDVIEPMNKYKIAAE